MNVFIARYDMMNFRIYRLGDYYLSRSYLVLWVPAYVFFYRVFRQAQETKGSQRGDKK